MRRRRAASPRSPPTRTPPPPDYASGSRHCPASLKQCGYSPCNVSLRKFKGTVKHRPQSSSLRPHLSVPSLFMTGLNLLKKRELCLSKVASSAVSNFVGRGGADGGNVNSTTPDFALPLPRWPSTAREGRPHRAEPRERIPHRNGEERENHTGIR